MLSTQVLNQLHIEYNEVNDLQYHGVLIGENTVYKSIKVDDTESFLNNYILIFNKDSYDINLWCVSLNKSTFESSIEYMYNLQDDMAIEYSNRIPILNWIYNSFTYENIIDFINRLMN